MKQPASLFASLPSLAAHDAAGDPGAVAEKFYAGYVAQVEANKDTKKWVAGSKLVTTNFKKTCAKAMSAEESLPPGSGPVGRAEA